MKTFAFNLLLTLAMVCLWPSTGAALSKQNVRSLMQSAQKSESDALHAAREFMAQARATDSDRFAAYSLAALKNWQDSVPGKIIQADALQYLHRFSEAEVLLREVRQQEPENLPAVSLLAQVLQAQGKHKLALVECAVLVNSNLRSIGVPCQAWSQAMLGNSKQASQTLVEHLSTVATNPEVVSWVLGMLGDLAAQQGEALAAEEYFRLMLQLDSGNDYAQLGLLDLALSYPNAVKLNGKELSCNPDSVAISIRQWAIKGRIAEACRQSVESWVQGEMAHSQVTHARDLAIYFQRIKSDPVNALAMAAANFEFQREPIDIVIYSEIAQSQGANSHTKTINKWIKEHSYQDARLNKLEDKS